MANGIIDIDELVLKCRGERAKEYIQEAVSCYKAGAYRAAIVSTWASVCLDFIHKVHELVIAGDKRASVHAQKLEQIRNNSGNNYRLALDFEKTLLTTAKNDLELITDLEFQDLERLRIDRNRCAHPTMQSEEELYSPTPELARTHLRNAIELFLQREPLQGRHALSRILDDISSPFFPKDINDTTALLRSGHLKRPSFSLLRSLFLVLTKEFIDNLQSSEERRKRILSVLISITALHPESSKQILSDSRLSQILEAVSDENLHLATVLLSMIPESWALASARTKLRTQLFVKSDSSEHVSVRIFCALDIPELRTEAVRLLGRATSSDLATLIDQYPRSEYTQRAIDLYRSASSFRSAEYRANALLLPLCKHFTTDQLCQIIDAIPTNSQILNAHGIPEFTLRLYRETISSFSATRNSWQRLAEAISQEPANFSQLLGELRNDGITFDTPENK